MAGFRPLQDPPFADLVRAQRLLGCFQAVLSVELDPVVSRGLGWEDWGLSLARLPSFFLPPNRKGAWWRQRALSGSCEGSPLSSSPWPTSSITSHRCW